MQLTKLFYFLAALSLLFLITLAGSEYLFKTKAENLQYQKELSSEVYTLKTKDLDLANIQYRGKNTTLRHESDALQQYYTLDYVREFFTTIDHKAELTKLKKDISSFNIAAGAWYTQESIEDDQRQVNKTLFDDTYKALTQQIEFMALSNKLYHQNQRNVFMSIGIPLLLLTFISGLLANRRSAAEKKAVHAAQRELQRSANTAHVDQNSKKAERSINTPKGTNPAYIDADTGINNLQGFMHAYNELKGKSFRNYTAVCLFSVDNLEAMETRYPADFSESILKKVGFMLALFHHDRDIIGRLAHNKFAIILSREDKATAINDCELIRKSLAETPFTTEGGQALTVTISGGFLQKMSTQNINEILKKADKVLTMSVQHGGNRIAQLRDKNAAMK